MRRFKTKMGYLKAVYVTLMTMGVHYIEHACTWIKAAVWDAPRRVILDVQLEKYKLEREDILSEIKSQENQDECATTSHSSPTISE
jgi:hypothetical protein